MIKVQIVLNPQFGTSTKDTRPVRKQSPYFKKLNKEEG